MYNHKIISFVMFETNAKIFSGCHPRFSVRKTSFKMVFPRYRLQRVDLVLLSYGPSDGDVGPGYSHGHEARLVTDAALCD
jgi:hypothetical protein